MDHFYHIRIHSFYGRNWQRGFLVSLGSRNSGRTYHVISRNIPVPAYIQSKSPTETKLSYHKLIRNGGGRRRSKPIKIGVGRFLGK
jgi:hypothetical protein